MNKTITKKIALILIFSIILSYHVLALGVSPGRTTMVFEPGLEKTIDLIIINNEQKDLKAVLYAKDGLSDYVTLEKAEIEFKANEKEKHVSYTVKLPNKLNVDPGTYETQIIAREVPKEEEGEIVINTIIAVASLLDINIPYPGKYVRADLFVTEAGANEEISFVIPIQSLGEEGINNVKASIDIFDPNNEKVDTIKTTEFGLNKHEKKELIGKWKTDKEGSYKAVADIEYDGKKIKIEKVFNVGGFLIKLHDISVKNFRLGMVAEFNILVENTGNREVEDFYSNMKLNDNEKNIMDQSSAEINLKPNKKTEVNTYWNTENVKAGEYSGSISLNYEDKTSEKPIRTIVTEDSITVEIGGVTGFVAAVSPSLKRNATIGLIIMFLIIVNVAWYIYIKNKRKGKYNK